jgi:hypothetical protein
LKSIPPRRGLSGYYGVTKIRVDRWRARARVRLFGREVNLGQFDTKEKAAAAHDRAARHHLGQRYEFCNYASEMDAENAIREASEMLAVLINDGRMVLIGERYGEGAGGAAKCSLPYSRI